MKNRQSVLARFATLLTLVAFAMPVVTVLFYAIPAEASATFDADCGMMVIEKADMAQDHHKSKPAKAGDNCCIAHHCCAMKMVFSTLVTPAVFAVANADLDMLSSQNVPGRFIHGLERPPKSPV